MTDKDQTRLAKLEERRSLLQLEIAKLQRKIENLQEQINVAKSENA